MMNTELEWTESARNRWERFLESKVWAAGLDDEASQDLRENLWLHLEEELLEEECGLVTQDRIERSIAGLGGDPPKQEPQWDSGPARKRKNRFFVIAFGVVMPLLVFGLEFLTGFCGSVFFDPLPTWFHVALVLLVVVVNWWLLCKRSYGMSLQRRAILSGIAMGISAFYGVLFLPLVTLSGFAMIVFGMGLLSLTPVFNVFATWAIAKRHRNCSQSSAQSDWRKPWLRAFLASLAVLALMQVPSLWTRTSLQRALSDRPATAERGLAQLRFFHSEKTLLRACYEGNRGTSMTTDISGWLLDGWQLLIPLLWENDFRSFKSDDVRTIFYRVTGDPFNSKAPPSFVNKGSLIGLDRGGDWSEMQWDDHLGGDEVAVRLANLDLIQSRMDGHLDAKSGLAYQEWTLVFQNDNANAQEARMQMLLPEEGVVSRVTLWVNGEPREAAFDSKTKVKAAYQSVAVKQQRDPVLVTATGPGRVLVQCFPVPANGGKMKIRIGMTAPLKQGRVATPILLERNFGIARKLDTSVWMQGPQEFSYRQSESSHRDGEGQSLQLKLSAREIEREAAYFASQVPPATEVWCQDQFAAAGEDYLIRSWKETKTQPLTKCIVVVDGSASMKPYIKDLQAVLESYQDQVTVVIADDEVSHESLRKYRFRGGRDNGPALEWALREARKGETGAVLWVHGPQPLLNQDEEALGQLLERGTNEVALFSVACKPGGNRLLEKLFKNRAVQTGPRLSNGIIDLQPWLKELLAGGPQQEESWRRSASQPALAEGGKVWDQLARWWAAERVRKSERQVSFDPASVAFAAKYQLVTAYSGAVVLETAQQYRDHDLTPVDPSTTPDIPATPEPGTFVLLVLSSLLAFTRRRRAVA